MKSTFADLKKRGKPDLESNKEMASLSLKALLEKLEDPEAHIRSEAAICLKPYVNQTAISLLERLSKEKALYTRIAICETLEQGNNDVAQKMIEYLGTIGHHQYHELPDEPSKKKSYPLPRDIVARALGKMDSSNFFVLIENLQQPPEILSELLDAIGWMAFYHPELATEMVCEQILNRLQDFSDHPLLVWKTLTCLSAFPTASSIAYLKQYEHLDNILGKEARRSLALLKDQ